MDELFRQIQKKQRIDDTVQLMMGHPDLHFVLKELVKHEQHLVKQEKSNTGPCASQEQVMAETLTREALLGSYERMPAENGWHSVSVEWDGTRLWWRNEAGSQWGLSFMDGVLKTEEDCPYGVSTLTITLAQDSAGNYLSEVSGLVFNNELYQRESP